MTRVDFEFVKEHADFTAVLAHYHIQIIGSGDQVRIHCPFHDDKHPSCSVSLGQKVFNCKAGGCGKHGNVLHFVQTIEGCDVRQAAIRLAAICEIETSPRTEGARTPVESRERRPERSLVSEPETPPTAPREAPEGEFDRAGASTWLGRNPLRADHPYLVERVGQMGIERFGPCGYVAKGVMRGRAVLALHDPAGELVGFMGRWTGDLGELPEGEEKYKIPKGFPKSRYLYGLHRVKGRRWLVAVEGAFSVIRLQLAGLPALGLLGSTVSEHQIALLREHCPNLRQIVVLMDGDAAGRKAADTVTPALARGFPTRIVDLPEGSEPDTLELEVLHGLLNLRHGEQ